MALVQLWSGNSNIQTAFFFFLRIHEHDVSMLTSQTVLNIPSLLRHHDLMQQNLDQGVSWYFHQVLQLLAGKGNLQGTSRHTWKQVCALAYQKDADHPKELLKDIGLTSAVQQLFSGERLIYHPSTWTSQFPSLWRIQYFLDEELQLLLWRLHPWAVKRWISSCSSDVFAIICSSYGV